MQKGVKTAARKLAAAECCPKSVRILPKATRSYVPLFKALADETRLEMLGLLAASDEPELCVCDLESQFELGQPTVSHHLRILREAGLVTAERRGTWVYYALNREAFDRLRSFKELLETASDSRSSRSGN